MKKNLLSLILAGLLSAPSFMSAASGGEILDLGDIYAEEERKTETDAPPAEKDIITVEGEVVEEPAAPTTAIASKRTTGKKVYPRAAAGNISQIIKEIRQAKTSDEIIALFAEAAKYKKNRQRIRSLFGLLLNKIREELDAQIIRSRLVRYSEEGSGLAFDDVKARALAAIAPYGELSDAYRTLKAQLDALEFDYVRQGGEAAATGEEELVTEEGGEEEF